MEVKTFQQGDVTVFAVNGEINITTSPELKKAFEKQPAKKMVVDLEKVTYVDSSGLATLVEILKKIRASGGALGLSGLTDKVKSLFEITKLDKLFPIYLTQLDALTAIKQK